MCGDDDQVDVTSLRGADDLVSRQPVQHQRCVRNLCERLQRHPWEYPAELFRRHRGSGGHLEGSPICRHEELPRSGKPAHDRRGRPGGLLLPRAGTERRPDQHGRLRQHVPRPEEPAAPRDASGHGDTTPGGRRRRRGRVFPEFIAVGRRNRGIITEEAGGC
jgi:hypothetical protein